MNKVATLSFAEYLATSFLHNDVSEACQTLAALTECVPPLAEPDDSELLGEVTCVMDRLFARCLDVQVVIADDIWLLAETRFFFRDALEPWVEQSWFLRRGSAQFQNPLGDPEFLAAIRRGEPRSRGIGGYLDRYFLETDLIREIQRQLLRIATFQFTQGRLGRRVTALLTRTVTESPSNGIASWLCGWEPESVIE